jgi:aminomethyltransferase
VPVGLGARNTLRLEMGYSLYGHEIHRKTLPQEANLGWVVRFDKGSFIGREAMLSAKAAPLKRRLAAFILQAPGVARDGYAVLDAASGERIGEVTSGTPSPTLGQSIGLAYVPLALAVEGSVFAVEMRGRKIPAKVVKLPFVKSGVKR